MSIEQINVYFNLNDKEQKEIYEYIQAFQRSYALTSGAQALRTIAKQHKDEHERYL